MSEASSGERESSIGFNEVLRFFLELFAFVTFAIWGFVAWQFPWNIVVGVAAPLFAILLWALFRSPKAVVRLDAFGKALIEIIVMMGAALAWWQLGQPIVAVAFALVATASGIVNGRRELG